LRWKELLARDLNDFSARDELAAEVSRAQRAVEEIAVENSRCEESRNRLIAQREAKRSQVMDMDCRVTSLFLEMTRGGRPAGAS
jgi:predicted nuclease with TOPRIM domain